MDEDLLQDMLKNGDFNRNSLSVGALENEKSKATDERYYKKYLIVAVLLQIFNCTLQIVYTLLPLLIKSPNETEWYGGVFFVSYNNQYYQLFKCFGHDNSPCQLNLDYFYENDIDMSDFSKFKVLNIFVSLYYLI